MKKFTKLFTICLLFVTLVFTGCQTKKTVTVTFDSNGGSEVTSQTINSGETLTVPTTPTLKDHDFYGWYLDNLLYDFKKEVTESFTLIAKWGGYTPETDALKLTVDYANKDFIKDGIGEVTLIRNVDGDTTIFKTSGSESFTVRYLGINSPESTYRIEPWGFAASNYVKKIFKDHLASGGKIVLQAEDLLKRFDSTGTRYLGWVWLIDDKGDSRLLNLQEAELGYAQVKNAEGTQYYNNFLNAIEPLGRQKVKVYGEKDPDYDYSKTGTQMTIREIRETYGTPEQIEAYSAGGETTTASGELIVSGAGTKVRVVGTVIRKNGERNAYIQQYDEKSNTYYGLYVYGGYNQISKLSVGYMVEITAKIGYYYGSLQLTDLTSDSDIEIWSSKNESVVETVLPEDITINNYTQIGKLVKIENLKVVDYNDADNNSAFTLYASYTTEAGKTARIQIRVDAGISLMDSEGNQILSGVYFMNKNITSLIGIISYYNGAQSNITYASGRIQIMLTDMNDIVLA